MAHLPKYEQVKRQLLAELRSGVYPAGERIPTREELITKFGVTRTTINQALKELVDCGVLSTSRRGGTVFTGQQPPRRIAFVSQLERSLPGAGVHGETAEMSLLNPLLYRAGEFNLEFIDIKHFTPSPEFVERYDCLVAVMPQDAQLEALSAFPDKVLFINRYGADLNYISTNHRAAVRELVRHNVTAAGGGAQMFFITARSAGSCFVERERRAGFVDECAADQLFYLICEAETTDYDEVFRLLCELPIVPGKPVLMCAPSLAFSGAVIQWARQRKLRFGVDLFYSDFDNPHARRTTGEYIVSAVQDYSAMGREIYRALQNWGGGRIQTFIPCRTVD